MGCKVVMIGGGSYGWTPTLAKDLFLRQALRGGELALVDVNAEALELLAAYCTRVAKKARCGWKVTACKLETALRGADFVCVSISTGALEAMHLDYHIPERFGVYHTVGDTVGPGGISRTLRNVPVFVDFARKMEKHCPKAWMIHVTNPLSQLTRAVCKASSIKCVGLCHNFHGTRSFLASYLGAPAGQIDATSVGVNHFTWLKDLTCRGKCVDSGRLSLREYLRYAARQKGPLKTGTTDDEIEAMLGAEELGYYLGFELFERFGHFPVGGAPHVAENLPYYCNGPRTLKRHRIRRKGVLPGRRKGKEKARQRLVEIVKRKQRLPKLKASGEGFAGIVESLHTGKLSRQIVAMPNTGQVSNLPKDVIVETWALAGERGILPVSSGPIPDPIAGLMQTIVDEQELAVEAALTGDRNKVVQAMAVSPMLANKDAAEALADELLAAHKDLLPQFAK